MRSTGRFAGPTCRAPYRFRSGSRNSVTLVIEKQRDPGNGLVLRLPPCQERASCFGRVAGLPSGARALWADCLRSEGTEAILPAPETATGRIRGTPGCSQWLRSDAVESSLITARQRAPVSGYTALRLPSAGAESLDQSLDPETRYSKTSMTWCGLHVVIGQRARGGCQVMMRLIKERPPGAVVRAWCPKRSEEDVLWVRVAAGTG
jgi:hypothetical protein